MKKILSTIFAVLLLLTAAAQTRSIENELAADPKLAYGTDYPYLFKMKALTPAPAGYKAFYISHYGRHGSRYFWADYLYKDIDTLLTEAHRQHILTEAGEKFYDNFKAALPELKAGWGELTEVGWNQHKQIARTMYERFPEVFTDGGHVNAFSSLVGRCVMSMASFCLELKGCNPKLDIHELSSRFTLDAVVPGDRENNPQWRAFQRIAPRYESSKTKLQEDTILTKTILSRIFTSTAGLKKSPRRIVEDLKNLYTSLPSIGKEGMMCGIYTDEDVMKQWEIANLGGYSWVFGDQLLSMPILKDILNQAKDVVEGKSKDVATLRFGHDSYIGPLTVLLGIDGADRDPENPSEVKYCYQNYETSKASNIQLIFYRNKKNDVLVKCLLNGAESTLPLPADNYPYYKWSDFLEYFSSMVRQYPTEDEVRQNMMKQLGLKYGDLVSVDDDPMRPADLVPVEGKPGRWRTPGGDERRRSRWGLWTNYDDREGTLFPGKESWRVGDYKTLDLLKMNNGTKVKTAEQWWTKRRPELEKAVRNEVLGYLPDKSLWPKVTWKQDGESLTGSIDCSSFPQLLHHPEIQATLRLPEGATAQHPVPVMIVIASLNSIDKYWKIMEPQGWGVCIFNPLSVQADNMTGLNDYLIGLFNKGNWRKPQDIGGIGAWSWGISRLLDYLEAVPGVDMNEIGLTGHSRFGKTALLTTAFEPRIATCFPSDAGCGGTSTWRRHWGEDIEMVPDYWFCGNMLRFCGPAEDGKYLPRKVGQMSVDAYTVLALCAPRPVFINCGYQSQWADPYGTFLTAKNASPVYKLLTGNGLVCKDKVPVIDKEYVEGPIGFRLHKEGHTDEPDWPSFFQMIKHMNKNNNE